MAAIKMIPKAIETLVFCFDFCFSMASWTEACWGCRALPCFACSLVVLHHQLWNPFTQQTNGQHNKVGEKEKETRVVYRVQSRPIVTDPGPLWLVSSQGILRGIIIFFSNLFSLTAIDQVQICGKVGMKKKTLGHSRPPRTFDCNRETVKISTVIFFFFF